MRHLLLVPLLFAAAVALTGCRKSDAELVTEAKAKIVEGCKGSASALPDVAADKIDAFCTCSAENVVTALGPDGVRALDDRGELSATEEQMTQQAAMACLDKLAP
jgi:hypothetical protein